uniref:J domain-containing protein n=1 Tax=Panagrolaimus davidi TaxID=227884 RepID=A0A914P530_9BILA
MGNSYSSYKSYKNYYAVLGVRQYASVKEITKAYHRLSLKYHPDHNPSPEAGIKIREINEAHHVLVKSKNAQHYEAIDPKVVEENLRMQAEINDKKKTAVDELKELEKQNAIFDEFFSCVKCKTNIVINGGIIFGCGHNSCVSCSDTSEVCQRCKKSIQKRQPFNFQLKQNHEAEAVSNVKKTKDDNQMLSKNAQHFEAVDPQYVVEDLKMANEINKNQKATIDEPQEQNLDFGDLFCCVNCTTKISAGGILFGCGHISCDFCSDTFEICQSCKKSIQYRHPLLF